MAFDVFDRDKSGGISQNELKFILGEYNVNAKEHLWRKIIEQIDLNRDGQISYDEFHKMMMEVIKNKNRRLSMQLKHLNSHDIKINGISREQIGNQIKPTITDNNCKKKEEKYKAKKRNKSFFVYNKRPVFTGHLYVLGNLIIFLLFLFLRGFQLEQLRVLRLGL